MNASSILQSTRDLLPLRHRAPAALGVSAVTAQVLALLSVLLGAIELAAPRQLAARLGIGGKPQGLRAYGRSGLTIGTAGGIALLGLCVAGFLAARSRR